MFRSSLPLLLTLLAVLISIVQGNFQCRILKHEPSILFNRTIKYSYTKPRILPYQKAGNLNNERLPGTFKRVCYFRMDPKTEIQLHHIDGSLCTHIILAFVRIDNTGSIRLDRDTDMDYLSQVPEFKRHFPHVKVMVSVFNENEFNGFPKAALSVEIRQQFARSAMDFLKLYHLDGIDLDWEFPNFPTSFIGNQGELERIGLTKILKALRSAIVENYFDRQVAQQRLSGDNGLNGYMGTASASSVTADISLSAAANSAETVEPYLLTVAVAGQEAVMKAAYELRQVANLCDWLNIMSYDYFQFKSYTPITGQNSPLNTVGNPYVPIVNKLSFSWSINRLIDEGISKQKIVMGIPTYARAYRLLFRQSQPSPFTLALGSVGGRIDDYLDYREVLSLLNEPDTVVQFDERARVPYLLSGGGCLWVSYENPQSVREKVSHLMEHELGGYMTWNLNSDDFEGLTKDADQQTLTFPLHRAMHEESLLQSKS